MRRIKTEYLQPGMVLAKTVLNGRGSTLLAKGVTLNDNYITRLSRTGITAVYIEDPLSEGVEVPELISDQTRNVAINSLQRACENLQDNFNLDYKEFDSVVNQLMDEITANPAVMVNINEVHNYDNYTYEHSVNVSVLAMVTGLAMGYDKKKLHDLTLGALLHDVGKTRIPKDILNKPDRLTDDEFSEIQKHSNYGFDILRKFPEISLLSSHVAFQHHERYDGTGYPRGLSGEAIHEYARVAAVADVYDALITDRSYRNRFTPDVALRIISKGVGTHFDPEISSKFLERIAEYPVGTVVQLSTEEIGVVTAVPLGKASYPQIRVFPLDPSSPNAGKEIDLLQLPEIKIERILNEEEVALIRKKMFN